MVCSALPTPVSRPVVEVADVVRATAIPYRDTHVVSANQQRVLRAITQCRTAALGGHAQRCDHCGDVTVSYRSCRNRHCPKCQTLSKVRWVDKHCAQLLDINYWHLVFTLPHELNTLALGNPEVIYNLLFRAASQTLLAFGRNPRWLGGELGITMILHTWSQNLGLHIHVHCLVTGGALGPDGKHWLPTQKGFLFPTAALSTVFRAKYLDALAQAYRNGELYLPKAQPLTHPQGFECFVTQLKAHDWVVYAKAPFAGAPRLLAYLGRYTHRVAIANHRLLSFDGGNVRFRWRDYAHGNKVKVMTLSGEEFIRRFLLHTLPRSFVRIRHYGLHANRGRHRRLELCRRLLGQPDPEPRAPESAKDAMLRLTGCDISRCRSCGQGRLHRIAKLMPAAAIAFVPKATGPP